MELVDNLICTKCKDGYYNFNSAFTSIAVKCLSYKKCIKNECVDFTIKKKGKVNE